VKKQLFILFITVIVLMLPLINQAQCSMCTKTASQLGEKPALGLNNGIIYLMLTPFLIMGVIAYRWWRAEKNK
jgi:hypothetical protein